MRINLKQGYQGQLLIAQPTSVSSFFFQSVVLVCEHHDRGSWGLALNKVSSAIMVKNIAQDLGMDYAYNDPVYIGGPVQDNSIHFLHTPDVVTHNTWHVTNSVSVTSSVDMMKHICSGVGPKHWKLCVGISAWQAGQLEGEMSGQEPWTPQHRWLTKPCPRNLFELPSTQLWKTQTHEAINQSVNKYFN